MTSLRQIIRKNLWFIINAKRHGRYNITDVHLEKKYKNEIEKIKRFYFDYNDFRLDDTCAKVTDLDIKLCRRVKEYLYKKRIIGNYIFKENAHPQKYMRELVLKKHPLIDVNSNILEVGPGNSPIFDYSEYKNWFAVDKFYQKDRINFRDLTWAVDLYPSDKICQGAWENLYDSVSENTKKEFDLIISSHSFEHCFKPISSLIEASKLLKKDGLIVLFVPDGFSDHPSARDEMTHTLYLVPEMITEFFQYADVFYDLEIKSFRPNIDYIITAKKK